jgi:TolA-binding protein
MVCAGLKAQEAAPAPVPAPAVAPVAVPAPVTETAVKPVPAETTKPEPKPEPKPAVDPAVVRVAYEAAVRAFDAGLFPRAAEEFAALAEKYPESEWKGPALEQASLARAEAALGASQWKLASDQFAAFQREYPGSVQVFRAMLRELYALHRAGESGLVRDRLAAADGEFQKKVKVGDGVGELMQAGWMLLGETRLVTGDGVGALEAVEAARATAVTVDQQWQRERLRYEAARVAGKAAERVAAGEVLLGLAGGDVMRRAEATSLMARALEAAGQGDKAEPWWERNTDGMLPAEFQREAVLRLVAAWNGRQDWVKSRARLERFLAGRPVEPMWHPVRLALGQVLFRQYAAVRGTGPIAAEVAALPGVILSQLDPVLTNEPPAELIAPIQYLRGWCLWEQGAGVGGEKLKEADVAFREALKGLPATAEQATARFKLGDAALLRNEPAEALRHYLGVAEGYVGDAVVDRELRPFAWRQAVTSAIAATNGVAATQAMERLLATHPDAEVAGRSALLVGQSLMRTGSGAQGRDLLAQFAARFPDSGVTAEVRLALATGHLGDRQWVEAMREFDVWTARYTNHPALPEAEYGRAFATANAGMETNAVEQFRSVARRFPTNLVAQDARLWLGAHYFNQGDFGQSEQAYLGVLTNGVWKGTPAVRTARVLAGRSALARGSVTNAVGYFLALLNDPTAAEAELASGYYYLGEAKLAGAPVGTNGPLSTFTEALDAFRGAVRFTNQPIIVAVWGRMAYCHLQLGVQSPVSYTRAAELFQRVVESPLADVGARAKGLIGLGTVAERMASGRPPAEAGDLLERALKHYLDVVLGSGFLKPGESVPPRLLEEAGVAAGQLLEERRRYIEASGLYERLGRELPATKPVWDARRDRVRKLGTAASAR